MQKLPFGRQSTLSVFGSIITAVRVFNSVGASILTAVRVFYPVRASILTAVRVFYPFSEALCRPTECSIRLRKHYVGRQSTLSDCESILMADRVITYQGNNVIPSLQVLATKEQAFRLVLTSAAPCVPWNLVPKRTDPLYQLCEPLPQQ